MDIHTLKLVVAAGVVALAFGAWLLLFLRAERPGQLLLSLIAYPALLGLLARGCSAAALSKGFTAKDVATISVLAILFSVLSYALARIIAVGGDRGSLR
jgi:hypothetical protein